jgi:hypothetical protein
LRENGFTLEGYDEPMTPASFLGIPFALPNTARHRWGIMLHDLHHVATGYGTDLTGEGEISIWELAGGLRPLGLYVGSIVASGALMGMLLAPRRALQAWRAAASGRSLFGSKRSYEDLLAMSVGELRRELGVPEAGLADRPRAVHSRAPRESRERSKSSSQRLQARPPA